MENKTKILSIICVAFILLCQCKKEAEPQLPPITTTGANTFGCKVNGRVFVPRDGNGKPGLYAQYANFNTGPGATGGWYLNIPAIDYQSNDDNAIVIQTDSLLIAEGLTYEFKLSNVVNPKPIKGTFYTYCDFNGNTYAKTAADTGQIRILRFDQFKRLISATFSYSATNISSGEKINITDGRFDILY
jgi:hypothetical protein